MQAFGTPTVVNPFDRFGDHLRIALRAPASYQLMTWLESGPGAPLPQRGSPPSHGHWVMCGYGRFGQEVTDDLRAEGLDVAVIESRDVRDHQPDAIIGSGYEPGVLVAAGIDEAVGFVAGTDNDTTNLSLVIAARKANPKVYVAARQNKATSASLRPIDVDSLLVPADVVAHEVYAQLSTLMWRFLQEVPRRDDAWAAGVIDRLMELCGEHLQAVWKVRLAAAEAPALQAWLATGEARLGDLLRNPDDRDERLHTVPLLLAGRDRVEIAPPPRRSRPWEQSQPSPPAQEQRDGAQRRRGRSTRRFRRWAGQDLQGRRLGGREPHFACRCSPHSSTGR